MFENLSERLERSFQVLKGQGSISEINISETLKEVRKSFIDADVDYKVANNFIKEVKKKALGQNVLTSVKPKDLFIKIVRDEMVALMGGGTAPLNTEGRPAIILLAGLQGAGKTTFAAKLAAKLKSTGAKHPLLVGADVYRPAAREQLRILAEEISVPFYTQEDTKDAVKIARDSIDYARENKLDLVIVDTAGRLEVDEQMMKEISDIKEAVKPQETLFVIDSMLGQNAVAVAKAFNERIDYDGVILTKLDGDARGGAALSIRAEVNKPIKYVGIGEKMGDLQPFDPEGMADRILGMGDIRSLVSKIQEVYDQKDAEKLEKKFKTNKFDFNDFIAQINQVKKMGSMKQLVSMLPGVGKALKDIDIPDDAFKSIEAMIGSMTPYERENPDKIKGTRRQRIARGSGTSLQEVNRLLKQFEDMRSMMQKAATMKNPMQMARQMRQAQKGRRR